MNPIISPYPYQREAQASVSSPCPRSPFAVLSRFLRPPPNLRLCFSELSELPELPQLSELTNPL